MWIPIFFSPETSSCNLTSRPLGHWLESFEDDNEIKSICANEGASVGFCQVQRKACVSYGGMDHHFIDTKACHNSLRTCLASLIKAWMLRDTFIHVGWRRKWAEPHCGSERGQMIRVHQVLSWWSSGLIHRGWPVFTRPQPEISRQLYGSPESMRTLLEAMWSLLQACRLLSSCCLTVCRDALSQQEQKHTHAPNHPADCLTWQKRHNYTFSFWTGPILCVWARTGLYYIVTPRL